MLCGQNVRSLLTSRLAWRVKRHATFGASRLHLAAQVVTADDANSLLHLSKPLPMTVQDYERQNGGKCEGTATYDEWLDRQGHSPKKQNLIEGTSAAQFERAESRVK